jgi:alpha-L-arabinofuranosidase
MYANYLEKYYAPAKTSFAPLVHNDKQTSVLDAIVTCDKEAKRFVCAVVNKDPNQDAGLAIDFASMGMRQPKEVSAWVLAGRSADDYNDRGDEHVRPEQRKLKVKNSTVSIPAHSLTFITVE